MTDRDRWWMFWMLVSTPIGFGLGVRLASVLQ
jgi:hypothetical protein